MHPGVRRTSHIVVMLPSILSGLVKYLQGSPVCIVYVYIENVYSNGVHTQVSILCVGG